ncbi:MAG: hypothetical protein K9L17_02430 [Clostridiales bacterium]|nr:hypothetical protein [Clostridiales bacterium]MCF8021535.1 hypothetical protein [Clostridiales bacterium]
MKKREKDNCVDHKEICKKYSTNVKKLISAWKKGYSDMEISKSYGVEIPVLQQIKSDLELAHRRKRMEKKKNNLLFSHYHT